MTRASPYMGLDYFDENDAGLFFGRESERKKIITNVRASRLTLLYAESGVGKSSLLRAGVAARLRESASAAGREQMPVVFSTWRDDPVPSLIGQLEATVAQLRDTPAIELPRDR